MTTSKQRDPQLPEILMWIILGLCGIAYVLFSSCSKPGVYVEPVYLIFDVEFRSHTYIAGYDLDGERIWAMQEDTCFIVTPRVDGELFVNGEKYQMLCKEPGRPLSYYLWKAHEGDSITFDHMRDGSINFRDVLKLD